MEKRVIERRVMERRVIETRLFDQPVIDSWLRDPLAHKARPYCRIRIKPWQLKCRQQIELLRIH